MDLPECGGKSQPGNSVWRLQPDGHGHQRNAAALRPGPAHSAVISRIKSPIKGLYPWQERLLPIAAVPTNSPAIL